MRRIHLARMKQEDRLTHLKEVGSERLDIIMIAANTSVVKIERRWQIYEEHAQKAKEEEEKRKAEEKEEREKRMRRREKLFQLLQKREDGRLVTQ